MADKRVCCGLTHSFLASRAQTDVSRCSSSVVASGSPSATEVWLEKRSVGTRRRDERASECSEAALRAMRRDSA